MPEMRRPHEQYPQFSSRRLGRRSALQIVGVSGLTIGANIACGERNDNQDYSEIHDVLLPIDQSLIYSTSEFAVPPDVQEVVGNAFEARYPSFRKTYLERLRDDGSMRYKFDDAGKLYAAQMSAFGMQYAVSMDDRERFDNMWLYKKKRSVASPFGLEPYLTNEYGAVEDKRAIFDNDIDTGMALMYAQKTWGGYEQDLDQYVEKTFKKQIEPLTFYPHISSDGGGSVISNPSHFDPYACSVFSQYNPEWKDWKKVGDVQRDILNRVMSKRKKGIYEFVSDFVEPSTGIPKRFPNGDEPLVHADTTRIPIRQLLAAVRLEGMEAKHARTVLAYANDFYERIIRGGSDGNSFNILNLKNVYKPDGTPVGEKTTGAWITAAAAASIASKTPQYREYMIDQLLTFPIDGPFDANINMDGLVVIGNKLPKVA